MPPSTPWEQFKFGLFFGMGFCLSMAVLRFIVMFLAGARLPQGF
jgi:hypothetical protein